MALSVTAAANATDAQTVYDFNFTTLIGNQSLPLKQFEGKVLLIVNTASKCGLTGQYEGLQKLYDTYKDRGLVVLGVPSNDFGSQEPGTAEEIEGFCRKNYGVTFPMASKEAVVGDGAHPFYRYAAEILGFGTKPKWNFHKYLVDREGRLVDHFNSTTAPDAASLIRAIEERLGAGNSA